MAKKARKIKVNSIEGFDAVSYRQTESYVNAVDQLYNEAINEFTKLAGRVTPKPDKVFSFADYPVTKSKAAEIIQGLTNNMQAVITEGSRKQWLFACEKNDQFLNSILDTSKVNRKTLAKYQDRNLDALKTFQGRKINGLGLSDRIWNYTDQMKTQMELGIDIALGDGRSAQALSRDLRQYLVDPDKLFRRVRDKHGNLVLSKNAKAFHPGQGKYRSSYKNAMRLTRTEINMAYRESDQLRWQQLDFVVGFEVKLSNNHTLNGVPFVDICDRLAGKYPKQFKFKGWHPQCKCHLIPIMQDRDEFNDDELNELKAAFNDTEYKKLESKNTVRDVPENFKNWVKENAERSKGWKSQPFFIKDNFKGGNIAGGLNLGEMKPVQAKKVTVEVEVEVEVEPVNNFVPAKTLDEAEKRISELGIKEVSLKGLKANEFNAVLDAIQTESKNGALKLEKLSTYRSNSSAKALYSPSNNSISINLANVRKEQFTELLSYELQIEELQRIKKDLLQYLGNPKYKQSTVSARINSVNNRIFEIGQKIRAGEKSRYFTVSSGMKDQAESLKATIFHEIGHYRQEKTIGKNKFFAFNKSKSISEYGRTNSSEYFAEFYSHYRIYGEDQIPKDLLELFKSIK